MILLFGIGGGEILILLLLVLLLFGPSKIPEIARMLGRGVSEVRKAQRDINAEIQRYTAQMEQEKRAMQSEINQLKDQIKQTTPGSHEDIAKGEDAASGEAQSPEDTDDLPEPYK